MYQLTETIRLKSNITNMIELFSDPSTIKINIYLPDKSKIVSEANMIKLSKGKYYYDFENSTIAGDYIYEVIVVGSGGRITIERDSFTIEKDVN
jgi:hypothetical protein